MYVLNSSEQRLYQTSIWIQVLTIILYSEGQTSMQKAEHISEWKKAFRRYKKKQVFSKDQ